MDPVNGANELTVEELEALFHDEDEQATPPAEQTEPESETTNPDDGVKPEVKDTTKAFAKRLSESTAKARREERETMAKELGYESYEDLRAKRELKLMEDKGLNPDDVAPVVEEIIKKRLDEDPRIKELAKFKEEQVKEYGKRELAEISKLTDGEITKFDQLPKEVVELWKQKGSLKAAYLELKGEELILKTRSEHSKGSASHLASPTGTPPPKANVRHLTEKERVTWKVFNPTMTDEDLDKQTVEI